MPDKKALEVLQSWLRLAYHNADGTDEDSAELYEALQTVFALINRLQAENTNLKGHLKQLKSRYDIAKSENERLQNCIDEQDIEISRLYKRIDETKAEAYKECIEKVKENFTEQFCGQKYDLIHSWFNNALKELVGDAE